MRHHPQRYQWWRDALTTLAGDTPPPAHPVLTALWHSQLPVPGAAASSTTPANSSGSSTSSRLGRYQLRRMLDAREADALAHQTPLTLGDLEAYAEATASQLMYLQLAAAGKYGVCVCMRT